MILINFASRSRPEKFFRCIENIHINSRGEDFLILASLDEDDKTMFNDDVKERLKAYTSPIHPRKVTLYPIWGHSENKIHAINRSMKHAPENWDIVINTSDDMWFIEEGFDKIIERDMAEFFPDLDGVLHYPDQNQGENCMTMTIMGRKYYERDGFIYHPSYKSLWSDLESQEVAQARGKYKFVNKRLFNHNHPSFGQTPYDEQYRRTEGAIRHEDEKTYLKRKSNGFR